MAKQPSGYIEPDGTLRNAVLVNGKLRDGVTLYDEPKASPAFGTEIIGFETVQKPIFRAKRNQSSAQIAQNKFWEQRRRDLQDDRAGRGIFGPDWPTWGGDRALMQWRDRETGKAKHIRLISYDVDAGAADIEVVRQMVGESVASCGIELAVPWPPPNADIRVIKLK